jgi:RNA polymerase sigma factor (TIGR02999 family)
MSEITRVLSRIHDGDPSAAEQLMPLVYEELRQLAAAKMAHEKPGQTLQPTALVHEAYLRLVSDDRFRTWPSRRYFFAAAARAMERVLVERARQKASGKRGGGRVRVDLAAWTPAVEMPPDALLMLHEALEGLTAEDPIAAEIVRLLYFGGFSVEQSATTLEISVATAYRHWAFARAWLHCRLDGPEDATDRVAEKSRKNPQG